MHVNACLLPGKKEEAKLTVANNGRSHLATVIKLFSSGPTLALTGDRNTSAYSARENLVVRVKHAFISQITLDLGEAQVEQRIAPS